MFSDALIPHGELRHQVSLTRCVNYRVAHAPALPETFSPPPRVSDPDMHQGTCVMHVPWCMPGSLTRDLFWSRWRGKSSRYSRRIRNPHFYVSGERPIATLLFIIAQVYRLSAVHCQMTRYSQRVPGYLTRYSVSANEISFDKKISQWDCVFQIRLGLQENDSPLHLVTSSGFLKA